MSIVADGPFTPVDQTLHTPIDVPKLNSYFPVSSSNNTSNGNTASFYSNAAYSESEDILTDVDESFGPNVSRTYSLTFTPHFDDMLMKVYTKIILLPTLTPFLGNIPPLGIVSRVASDTLALLSKTISSAEYDSAAQPTYDAQEIINKERLRNPAFKHILLLLIRRRLIDLCSALFNVYCPNYTPQLMEPTSTLILMSALASNGSSGNGFGSSVYGSMGWNPLSMSSLLLNEQAAPRLRSSSLNLRKQSLSRVNSCSTSSWLHIGSITSARSGHGPTFNMNPDYNGSTDSIQLTHDYVPASVIPRNSTTNSSAGSNSSSTTFGHGLASLGDAQTPPGQPRGQFFFDTITPPTNLRRDSGSVAQKSIFESERPLLTRSRSSSRGMRGSHMGPLLLNTDTSSFNNMANNSAHGETGLGFALNSPFASATSLSEEYHLFMSSSFNGDAQADESMVGLRSGRLIPEIAEEPTQNHRANLAAEFSLSEKKRDSLKLKRGIH